MKNLVWGLMAMFAITFASCGNKTTATTGTADTDTVSVDSLDTLSADSDTVLVQK